MLQTLRDKTSGWIATAVLGLLIIPFAFVGVNEYMTGGTDNAVAKVEAPPTWWQSAPGWWPLSMLWQPLIGGLLFLAGQVFTFLALNSGDVSVATPVLGVKIVLVALSSVLLLPDPVPLRWWIAAPKPDPDKGIADLRRLLRLQFDGLK